MANQQSNLPATRQQSAVATTTEQTLAQLVKRYEKNIVAALPTHIKPERVLSVIRSAITANPGLQKCSPMSVIAGIVAASRLGLELDPALGQAYLVPRWNKNTKREEATFQIGYRGKVELMQRATPGLIVQVRHVRENDKFELTYEPKPRLIHTIDPKKPRGEVCASYTYVEYPDGRCEIFEPMTIEEAFKIRDRYAPHGRCPSCWGKRGDREHCQVCNGTGETEEVTGPWATDTDEMVRKTCLHRDSKWISQSSEMKDSVRIENRLDSGEAPETVVLDIPAEAEDNAVIAGATASRQENLTKALEGRKAQQNNPAQTTTGGVAPGGDSAGPAGSGAAGNDGPEGSGTTPKQQTQPAAQENSAPQTGKQQPTIFEAGQELPDPLEINEDLVQLNGVLYERNEDNTGWRKLQVEQQQEQRQSRPAPRKNARNADAFDFGGNR